jgi:hypothetical protein
MAFKAWSVARHPDGRIIRFDQGDCWGDSQIQDMASMRNRSTKRLSEISWFCWKNGRIQQKRQVTAITLAFAIRTGYGGDEAEDLENAFLLIFSNRDNGSESLI